VSLVVCKATISADEAIQRQLFIVAGATDTMTSVAANAREQHVGLNRITIAGLIADNQVKLWLSEPAKCFGDGRPRGEFKTGHCADTEIQQKLAHGLGSGSKIGSF
jgi:hypothetical protein